MYYSIDTAASALKSIYRHCIIQNHAINILGLTENWDRTFKA